MGFMTPSETNRPTYRSLGLTATPFSQNQTLVRSEMAGRARVLTPQQADLLFACQAFETLDGHATARATEAKQRLAQQQMAGTSASLWGKVRGRLLRYALNGNADDMPVLRREIEPVQRLLAEFAQEGFLVNEADVRSMLLAGAEGTASTDEPGRHITAIGIPTRDRPESLARALASYAENARRYERDVRFVVADDSRSADVQAENRQRLGDVAERYNADVRYLDRAARADFAEALARRADVPPEVARFGLLGDERFRLTYGAARNTLLLSTAGEVSLQVDDDTVCELRAAPETTPGLAVSSKGASAFWHFEDRDAALAATPLADADFLALHETLLGRPPATCAAEVKYANLDLNEVGYATLRYAAVPEAQVRVTFAGAVGDSATTSPAYLLYLRGASLRRATQTEAAYRMAKQTRQLLRAPTQATITDGGPCMTTNIGLDGRALLPPFLPVLRNEDGLFGSMLRACFKHAFRGHLAGRVLLHDPPEPRKNHGHIAFEPYGAGSVLMHLISAFGAQPHSETVLQALGVHLQDIGAAPSADFAEYVRVLCFQDASSKMRRLRQRLEKERSGPAYWVEDVRRYLSTVQQAMEENRLAPVLDGGEQQTMVQELICRFGELCAHWPALWEAALELRAEGHPLAGDVRLAV